MRNSPECLRRFSLISLRREFATRPILQIGPIACCVAIVLCASAARADLPQRALVGNFIGYDAFPENYLSISGSVARAQNGESLYLKKPSLPIPASHFSPATSVSSSQARRPPDSAI